MDAAAGQLPRQPGVYGAESQFATLGAGAGAGDMVEQPFQFGSREVRVENQAGALAEQFDVTRALQGSAQTRRPPVLPNDSPVQRLSLIHSSLSEWR